MTERVALYRLFGEDGELLYVGITKDFVRRWETHAKEKPWWPKVSRSEAEWLSSRGAAERAEEEAIKTESPTYNVMFTPKMFSSSPSRGRAPIVALPASPGENPLAAIRLAQQGVAEADARAAKEVKSIKDAARVELGRAINEARDAGTKQADIAAELGLTREQVRRLQVAAREADGE